MLTVACAGYITTPKVSTSGEGLTIFSFSVGVKQYDYQTKEPFTQFVNVAYFGKKADSLKKVLDKGAFVSLSGPGKISQREYKGELRLNIAMNSPELAFVHRADGAPRPNLNADPATAKSDPRPQVRHFSDEQVLGKGDDFGDPSDDDDIPF